MIKDDMLRVKNLQMALVVMPVIAVVRGDCAHVITAAVPVLQAHGLRALEITLNSPNALETIAHLPEIAGDIVIGAGTVNAALKLTYFGDVAWTTREDLGKHLDGAALETWR
jgi:2-keto-3-deoxy-6-phosphogluconate aldolase